MQVIMSARSDSLFHYTRSLDSLKSILVRGFLPNYCLEDFFAVGFRRLAIPMVSFCDIPYGRANDHMAFYGEYAIGMSRRWAVGRNVEAVHYEAAPGVIGQLINAIIDFNSRSSVLANEPIDNEQLRRVTKRMFGKHFDRLFCIYKPATVTVTNRRTGRGESKDVFQECEYRYVPDEPVILDESEFNDQRVICDRRQELQQRCIELLPSEVVHLIVSSADEAEELKNFVDTLSISAPHRTGLKSAVRTHRDMLGLRHADV